MSESAHARISPSGAKRWIACPPSIRLGDNYPDNESGAAAEGTLAHRVAEILLKKRLHMISPLESVTWLNECMNNPFYSLALRKYAEEYVDFVLERFAAAKGACSTAMIFIETKVDLSDAIPDSFGFTDATIIADGMMEQIDLKFGKGVPVHAEKNEQQLLYAYGNLKEFDFIFDIQLVRITIYQPRIDNTNYWDTTPEAIRKWVKEVATPAALLAAAGEGSFRSGEHCQFCKAKGQCRARAEDNLKLAQEDFKSAELLSDEEIANILLKEKEFTGWIKAVKEYALQSAREGKQWPGFKLVRSEGHRTYTDKQAVIDTLTGEALYNLDQISTREPLGVVAMGEFLGKKIFDKYLAKHITRPQGDPTLAPLTDKRPAIGSHESAIKDFS